MVYHGSNVCIRVRVTVSVRDSVRYALFLVRAFSLVRTIDITTHLAPPIYRRQSRTESQRSPCVIEVIIVSNRPFLARMYTPNAS